MRAVAWAPLPLCASGTAGGECGDSLTDAQCVGSTWKCPTGTIAASLCGCFDWQPTCSPGTAGGAMRFRDRLADLRGDTGAARTGRCPPTTVPCVLSGDGVAANDGGCP